MKFVDWVMAVAMILALIFIYGYVDGTIQINQARQEAKK